MHADGQMVRQTDMTMTDGQCRTNSQLDKFHELAYSETTVSGWPWAFIKNFIFNMLPYYMLKCATTHVHVS